MKWKVWAYFFFFTVKIFIIALLKLTLYHLLNG